MRDYRTILRQVGLALIVYGLADITFMIYCISRGQSYSSSFNIFSVIAGVFLARGSLGAIRIVTWFSAFLLAGFIGAIFIVLPFVEPFGLLIAQVQVDPTWFVTSCLMAVVALVLLGWTYRQLRSAPVLGALQESGRSTATPKLAFGLGLVLVVFLAVMLNMTLHGAAGEKAIALARQKLGPNYSYAVESIQWGGGHGSAVVAAYNNRGIKHVSVEWSE